MPPHPHDPRSARAPQPERGQDSALSPQLASEPELPPRRREAALRGTPRRWVAAVALSAAVPAALIALGAPTALGVVAGLLIALLGIGDLVAAIVRTQNRGVHRALGRGLSGVRDLLADEQVAEATHGHLHEAKAVLEPALERLAAEAPSAAEGLPKLRAALARIDAFEAALERTKHRRGVRRRTDRAFAIGGLVADADPDPTLDPDDQKQGMKLYGDPTNLPDWITSPALRDLLPRIGDVLDDVRRLHNAEIEWAVLLFTMWARLLLVGFAPLLAVVTFGQVPLEGGFALRDVPWVLAVACSATTAAVAPWLAGLVMRRDDAGARARRILLLIEVPIAVAVILTAPSWPVAVFAAGWTNWWQRPVFHWIKLALWIVAVVAAIAAGMAVDGVGAPEIVAESTIAMLVIAIVGGSYGAMLPVSASVTIRVVVGGLIAPRRARRQADEQLRQVISQLLQAASVLDAGERSPTSRRAIDGEKLRDIADALSARADRGDRWAGRTPLGLRALIESALDRGGPRDESPRADYLADRAASAGDPAPVTVTQAIFRDGHLALLRFTDRRAAAALSRFIVEAVGEARRHGRGPLLVECREQPDARIALRFVNAPRDGPSTPGRGSGEDRLTRLAAGFDGTIDARRAVDGTEVDLRRPVPRFLLRVSFTRRYLADDQRRASRPSA